jgi:hypothetical protein
MFSKGVIVNAISAFQLSFDLFLGAGKLPLGP